MFEKKPKLDSKIRFQRSEFRKELQSARGYKRQAPKPPQGFWSTLLFKVGLGSLWFKIAFVAVVLALIYLAFIPNFLYIKTVNLSGLQPEQVPAAQTLVANYLKQNSLHFQRNIVFLSKSGLSNYLEKNSNDIQKVLSVRKLFPNGLMLNLQPRISQFVVNLSGQDFLVSSDGFVGEALVFSSSTPAEILNFPKISVQNGDQPDIGSKILNSETLSSIQKIQNTLLKDLQVPVDSFALNSATSTDIQVKLKPDAVIYFDLKQDTSVNLSQLKLLWQNLSDNQRKSLYYIDMRYEGRGFVCLKTSVCAQNSVPTQTATTTPTINTSAP